MAGFIKIIFQFFFILILSINSIVIVVLFVDFVKFGVGE